MAEGKFSIVNFYERRARRILPALFFVMAACLPFAWMWLTPNDLKDFGQSLIAVSTFSSNILFWQESGYFDTAAELKPLLHTWSLAVEEQYYILFPIFLMLTWRLGIKWILILLSIVFLVSLGVAQWGAYNAPSATFFLLPTRGWELLVGVFAAFYLNYNTHLKSHSLNQVLSLLGFGMIVYSIIAFDKTTPFPSLYALIPTIGTGLLILCAVPKTYVHKLLSLKFIVGIGLISYSAYLWHQPLLAFARHRLLGDVSELILIALCFISLVMAWFSWKFVEAPFRNKAKINRKEIFIYSIFFMLLFSMIGFISHKKEGMPNRFIINTAGIQTVIDQKCHNNTDTQNLKLINNEIFCQLGDLSSNVDTFLIGDSHAGSISDQIGKIYKDNKKSLYSFSGGFCAPAKGFSLERYGSECVEQMSKIINYIVSNEKITKVIIYAQWSNYTKGFRDKGEPQLACLKEKCTKSILENPYIFREAFVKTISRLTKSNKEIFIIEPSPEFNFTGHDVLYKNQIFPNSIENKISVEGYLSRNAEILDIFDSIKGLDINFIDLKNLFCDATNCYILSDSGLPYFSDTNHVNELGSTPIVDELLRFGLIKTE
tara:strand:+ start:1 stop:1800 length:1800 start_codon:yes stop_codon:yes gene_type:complete